MSVRSMYNPASKNLPASGNSQLKKISALSSYLSFWGSLGFLFIWNFWLLKKRRLAIHLKIRINV
jgi:hypothetical protein